MPNVISIIYYNAGTTTPFVILPGTSKRFTSQDWIPNVGDRIVVHSTDYSLMLGWAQSMQQGKFSNALDNGNPKGIRIITVVECIYDYSISDVGIICECQPI